MDFEPVIGLEIHCQLQTRTKIFCGCSTAFGAPPNSHVCPVCLGLPGALPVLNRQAVDYAIRAALALGCEIQRESIFARKNYFYPDLPKGYQISQYEQPLALGGSLMIAAGGGTRVGLTRIHMEEDAGKSLHEGFPDSDRRTYLDYNRSGVPLIEIVTEPDMRSAAEASEFFTKLRDIVVAIGINDGNMEEGSLRCDANVSVRRRGHEAFGIKAEVKNLNSFRYVQKAIQYEIERQIDVLESGGRVGQETRLFNSATGSTHSMRSKEEAHDYRYFPEPDLPPLVVTDDRIEALRHTQPELPDARHSRYVTTYGLSDYDAGVITASGLADLFEKANTAFQNGENPKIVSNFVTGEVLRLIKERGPDVSKLRLSGESIGRLLTLVQEGAISNTVAKDVVVKMADSGLPPDEIVAAEGLTQIDDESALLDIVKDVMTKNQDAIAQVRAGKNNAFGFLVGQVMKGSGGKANPKLANQLLRREIEGTP